MKLVKGAEQSCKKNLFNFRRISGSTIKLGLFQKGKDRFEFRLNRVLRNFNFLNPEVVQLCPDSFKNDKSCLNSTLSLGQQTSDFKAADGVCFPLFHCILGAIIYRPRINKSWQFAWRVCTQALDHNCCLSRIGWSPKLSFVQSCAKSGLRKLKFLKSLFSRNLNRSFPF